jgi:hypothetical protein
MRCSLSVANVYLALASLLELLASVESQESARMTGRDVLKATGHHRREPHSQERWAVAH